MTRDDVLCPVCWSILIEPVTFPCAHSICLLCFRNTVKEASWSCPCCRVRISNWSRRVEKNGTLVNQKLWDRIQKEVSNIPCLQDKLANTVLSVKYICTAVPKICHCKTARARFSGCASGNKFRRKETSN